MPSRPRRTVFQINPPWKEVTLDDIADAFHATHKLHPRDRKQYFYSIGIDYDNVMEYFTRVVKWNQQLYTADGDDADESISSSNSNNESISELD